MFETRGVSFKIPAAEEHKYQNIVNLELEITENPFKADRSRAFKMQNLYVNDENVLTTRHRLSPEKHINGDLVKLINVFNSGLLGTLYHIQRPGSVAIEDENKNIYKRKTVRIYPPSGFTIFEHNDVVFALIDGTIMVVDPTEHIVRKPPRSEIYIPYAMEACS